ncbi:MAG: glycosyltransferase [Balneolales bacterium]|nr:glycosyltransferase [Balneolales bacterium]
MTTFKLSNYFVEAGHDVKVFSFTPDKHSNYESVSLVHAKVSGSYKNAENQAQFSSAIQAYQPNVVINQMPYELKIGQMLLEEKKKLGFFLLGCLRNSLFSVKLNIDDYSSGLLPPPIYKLFRNPLGRMLFQQVHKRKHAAQLRQFMDTYDRYVMFADPNFMELEYFIGDYKKEKWTLIPNSIPDTLAEVPAKKKVLLYLGRLSIPQKRSDLLLPLWKKIKDALPDWEFWIVGDGPHKTKMERQVAEEHIERVHFFGRKPPYSFYEQASMVVMTSAFEGFPNVIVEAQSRAAVPVVMNSYPVAAWLLKEGKSGYLIKPFNLDEMAGQVKHLAKSELELKKMQQACLDRATEFTIDRVGKQWLELFEQVLKEV